MKWLLERIAAHNKQFGTLYTELSNPERHPEYVQVFEYFIQHDIGLGRLSRS